MGKNLKSGKKNKVIAKAHVTVLACAFACSTKLNA